MKFKVGDTIYSCEYKDEHIDIKKLVIERISESKYHYKQYDDNDLPISRKKDFFHEIDNTCFESRIDAINNMISKLKNEVLHVQNKIRKLEYLRDHT